MAKLLYSIDGTAFIGNGTADVYVSKSSGLLDRPKRKTPTSRDWPEYHGQVYDLSTPVMQQRSIDLSCFLYADGMVDFETKMRWFTDLFGEAGLRRLAVECQGMTDWKPLVYDCFLNDALTVTKTWHPDQMVGEFSVKLVEPEPEKRILRVIPKGGAPTAKITLTTDTSVSIYWGDGSHTDDVFGTDVTVTHAYSGYNSYLLAIHGVIGNITAFTHNCTLIWDKL